jgi:chromosome segregation ATPase
MSRQELHDERERIEIAIKGFEDQLREAERHGETRNEDLRKELARLRSELQLVENELKYTKGLHDRFRF